MTLLAAVHLSPVLTIPLAIALACGGVWQLRRRTAPGTPPSRTRIRWLSMVTRLLILIPFALGTSVFDPDLDPGGYTLCWGVAVGLLGLSALFTSADVTNTLRLRARERARLEQQLLSAVEDAVREPE